MARFDPVDPRVRLADRAVATGCAAGRGERRSAPSTASPGRRSTRSGDGRSRRGRPRLLSRAADGPGRARTGSPRTSRSRRSGSAPHWSSPGWITGRSASTRRCAGHDPGSVDGGAGADLPRCRCRPGRAAEETAGLATGGSSIPAPNACWQLDATEYVLTGGRTCVIFQLIDDHSRYAVASHVAWGETAEGAIAVVKKAIAAHGVPQRLLTDNGAALNPSRRGAVGQLVTYVTALGVEAITGKPYKPTTQGKNERFHQTLFRWLDKQPIAATLERAAGPGRPVRPASTTPSDPTRACPAGSHRCKPGRRPRKLNRHGPEGT